jgi:hypothetical protein
VPLGSRCRMDKMDSHRRQHFVLHWRWNRALGGHRHGMPCSSERLYSSFHLDLIRTIALLARLLDVVWDRDLDIRSAGNGIAGRFVEYDIISYRLLPSLCSEKSHI